MQKDAAPEMRLAAVGDDFKATLRKRSEASFFYCRDVNEHILATVIGLDKLIALRRIKPLYNTCRHDRTPLLKQRRQLRSVA
jgi:hypothetical protein